MCSVIGYIIPPDKKIRVVHPKYGRLFQPKDINNILKTDKWECRTYVNFNKYLEFSPLPFDEKAELAPNNLVFVCEEECYSEKYASEIVMQKTEIDVYSVAKSIIPLQERRQKDTDILDVSYHCCCFQFLVAEFDDCEKSMVKEIKRKFKLAKSTITPVRKGEESSEFGNLSWGFLYCSHRRTPYIIQYINSGNGFLMYKAIILKSVPDERVPDYPFSDAIDALFETHILDIIQN